MTAGLTFSTMSAKPTGACILRACSERFWASAAGYPPDGMRLGEITRAAAPRVAMVVARRINRRAGSTRDFVGAFGAETTLGFIRKSPSEFVARFQAVLNNDETMTLRRSCRQD